MKKNNKVLVIGLDGATWNLLKPLIEEKKLPTIEKLKENGCHGNLESCIPHVTFPAWKCYSTGKNPGKLGVYWWMDLDIKSRKTRVNSSNSFKSLEIWDHLGIEGVKCGIMGMPTTYPPKKVNGFMASEFNPSDSGYTYPEELETELKEKFGFIAEFGDYHGEDREKMAENRIKIMKQRFDSFKYLAMKFKPDFLHLTIFHIDNIQHFYWKYMEKNDTKFGKVIEKSWKFIDSELELLINEVDPDYVMVMSDHGFTSLKAIFNVHMWLLNRDHLHLKSKILKFLNSLKLLTLSSSIAKKLITLKQSRKISETASMTDIAIKLIDWEKCKVIALGEGLLYINRHAFKNNNELEVFRENLINELSEIRNPKTGEFIVKKVFRREDIYSGKYTYLAPDLIILPNEGYEIASLGLSKKLWDFSPKEEGWSAVHKLHGIYMVSGKDVKKGYEIKGAKIYDIAPTILHIFGIPIPNDMDGRVLKEIFLEDSEPAQREAKYLAVDGEREKVKDRIRRLKESGKL